MNGEPKTRYPLEEHVRSAMDRVCWRPPEFHRAATPADLEDPADKLRALRERLDEVEEAIIVRSTRYRLEDDSGGDVAIIRTSDGVRSPFPGKSARKTLVDLELGLDREERFFWDPAVESKPDPLRDELLARVRVLGERIQKLEAQVDALNGEPKTRWPLEEQVRDEVAKEKEIR